MGIYSNQNVRWILISGFLFSIASSIYWFTPTWLIYVLGGSNADLGRILGLSTLISVIVAIIASIFADFYRKDVLILLGGAIATFGIWGLSTSQDLDQVFIFVLVTSSGSSIVYPAVGALLANSVEAKNRNRIYGTQFLLNNGSGVIGSIMNYFIFRETGTEISLINIDYLRLSLQVGFAFGILAVIAAVRIRDGQSLSVEEEGSIASQHEQVAGTKWHQSFAPNAGKIIGVTLLSGIFIGFGAGTSVPYFPRFFFDIYGIDLSDLSLVFGVLTIVTAVWGKLNSNLGDRYGRVNMIVLNQMLAVVLLYLLATFPPLVFALLTLLVRNAVMNATGPLNSAILMEFTPRRYRSMTGSATQIGWSVFFGMGQIFGGNLVDEIGFRVPFIITASLYLIATVFYFVIGRYDRPVEIHSSS